MDHRIAFVGFRHGHINMLYGHAGDRGDTTITSACEEDDDAREAAKQDGRAITHTDFEQMLNQVDCDIVAVGAAFGDRGSYAIRALEAGKHVILDKPLCTRLSELDEIEQTAAQKNLRVGCMLNMRDSAKMIGVREILLAGEIGEVHAIAFGGQHPLSLGSRPTWYWEPGRHGGSLNDIGVHAMDAIPWMTGMTFTHVVAARSWNAFVPQHPAFEDAAQMMLTMSNGAGVLGDVSYHMPDSAGYSLAHYWRMTFFGRDGIVETSATATDIQVIRKGEKELSSRPFPEGRDGGYLDAFIKDVDGKLEGSDVLDTAAVLKASRIALTIQNAADEGLRDVSLE